MYYYSFHIGDYRKDTAHLTPIEHYIYRSLLDWMYLDEKPIPKETQTVMRRLSLGSENKPNLMHVLSDFFILGDEGYYQERVMLQIEDYKVKCNANRINGKLGGRPKKTQSVNFANRNESEPNPNQEPRTKNHKPLTNKKSVRFKKPTIEEIKTQCVEKGYTVDAETFWNFYESKNWKVGNNKMKSWKACLVTWQKREKDNVPRGTSKSTMVTRAAAWADSKGETL